MTKEDDWLFFALCFELSESGSYIDPYSKNSKRLLSQTPARKKQRYKKIWVFFFHHRQLTTSSQKSRKKQGIIINLLIFVGQRWKIGIKGKTRQNTENKQTFDMMAKIEIEEKNRKNAKSKQTFYLIAKNEIEKKIR